MDNQNYVTPEQHIETERLQDMLEALNFKGEAMTAAEHDLVRALGRVIRERILR